ncbi:MAG: AAA family ATPase [Eubacterium sp.]|nr:AAA family ATPase [Eubacterium sp.]
MVIKRDRYLNKLISKKENGLIKVITGIRRCGKSYLLFELYHQYLNSIGIADENIIGPALDEALNARYRNPLELDQYIRAKVADKSQKYYVFIDEIQKVAEIQNPYVENTDAKIGFVDVFLRLMKRKNVDLYVTGSNSRMLSSDILTEFKDRGDEIRVNPLTYSEFYAAFEGEKRHANSLNRIADSFKKIVVVRDDIIPWYDEKGIMYIGVEQFLLDEHAIDL